MPNQFIAYEANLFEMPAIETLGSNVSSITIGDLHANPIKLLHVLVRYGIISCTEETYHKLVSIYQNDEVDRIEDFELLLQQLKLERPDILIRLIGDECCDRGLSDAYVLLFLKRIYDLQQQAQLGSKKLTILLSNHGADFIYAYKTQTFAPSVISEYVHSRSLHNLRSLINRQKINPEALLHLIYEVYEPHLKLLDYEFDNETNTLSFFSHAPVDLSILYYLTERLNTSYQLGSSAALMKTIDDINAKCQQLLQNGEWDEIINPNKYSEYYTNPYPSYLSVYNAIEFCLWNRDYYCLKRSKEEWFEQFQELVDLNIHFYHGHDSSMPNTFDYTTLDSLIGKPSFSSGVYPICIGFQNIRTLQWRATSSSVDSFLMADPDSFHHFSPTSPTQPPLPRSPLTPSEISPIEPTSQVNVIIDVSIRELPHMNNRWLYMLCCITLIASLGFLGTTVLLLYSPGSVPPLLNSANTIGNIFFLSTLVFSGILSLGSIPTACFYFIDRPHLRQNLRFFSSTSTTTLNSPLLVCPSNLSEETPRLPLG